MRILDCHPPDNGGCALQATDRHMGGNKQCVLGECSLCKGMAAGEISVGIGPLDHPGWLLDFDCMMVEVAEAIQRLTIQVDAHKLVASRLTGCSDDAHPGEQVVVSLNEFQLAPLVKHPESTTVFGVGVLEGSPGFRVFPVGPAQVATSVGKARHILSLAFGGDACIVVEVDMSDDEMCDILWVDILLKELGDQVRWRLVIWGQVG